MTTWTDVFFNLFPIIVLTAVNIILPFMFRIIASQERYESPRTTVEVSLVRCGFFSLYHINNCLLFGGNEFAPTILVQTIFVSNIFGFSLQFFLLFVLISSKFLDLTSIRYMYLGCSHLKTNVFKSDCNRTFFAQSLLCNT